MMLVPVGGCCLLINLRFHWNVENFGSLHGNSSPRGPCRVIIIIHTKVQITVHETDLGIVLALDISRHWCSNAHAHSLHLAPQAWSIKG